MSFSRMVKSKILSIEVMNPYHTTLVIIAEEGQRGFQIVNLQNHDPVIA